MKIFYAALILLLYSSSNYAVDGELIVQVDKPTSNKFRLGLSTSEYAQDWDIYNDKIRRLDGFSKLYEDLDTKLEFDAPTAWNPGREIMPWGLITFDIIKYN